MQFNIPKRKRDQDGREQLAKMAGTPTLKETTMDEKVIGEVNTNLLKKRTVMYVNPASCILKKCFYPDAV